MQREIREIEGTTVIIYDQTCASEKRRRRKRNAYPDPAKRAFINDLVCEGCGDCGVQSNCVSIVPQETEFGRKRKIDQSSCNKDYSCVKGFCPSFVTVHGGGLRKGKGATQGDKVETLFTALPEPTLPALEQPYGIMVTGVGGTGVVTIGAILGMAANLENKGFTSLDMAGLAQKGGAVWAHLQVAAKPEDIRTVRLGAGGARLVLGCDLVVSASQKTMDTTRQGATRMVVNTHQQMTGDFTRNANFAFPAQSLKRTIAKGVGEGNAEFVEATRVATALMGDSIATNMFMLGVAYQKGLVPVSADAINKAIELNGAAVKMNQAAFLWGRRMAVDPAAVERMITPKEQPQAAAPIAESLDEMIRRRVEFLTGYQNAGYASKYTQLVERVRKEEQAKAKGLTGLAEAVARYYFKLLAYKDEYEVARLYADPAFMEKVKSAVRRRLQAALPSRAAAALEAQREGRADQARVRLVDVACLQGAGEAALPARHGAGHLRLHRGAAHRAAAEPGLRAYRRRAAGQAHPRQPCAGGADRLDPRGDPRLRPRQGAPPRGGEGEGGQAARGLARAGGGEGGGSSW